MCEENGKMDFPHGQNEPGDNALCRRAADGDRTAEETLVMRYARLVRICARPYFLAGADSEDLTQEGMFGLLKAIRDYDEDKAASFKTYAELCIRHRLYSAIRAANRDKHHPLNDSISFETPLFDEMPDPGAKARDPELLIIGREERRELLGVLRGELSGFEAKVLKLYLRGSSYLEIAFQVGRSTKSVDNAVQRIRRKLARHQNPGDISKS